MSDGSPPETTCFSVTLPISKDQGTVWDESLFPVHLQPSSSSRPALLNPRTRVCIASMCFVRSNRSQANYCCFRRLCFLLLVLHLVDSHSLVVAPCRFALFVRSLFVEPLSCSRFVCVCEVRPKPVPGRTELVLTHLTVMRMYEFGFTTDTLRALSCPKWVRSRDGSVSS